MTRRLLLLLTFFLALGAWAMPLRPNRVLLVASVQVRDDVVIRDAWDCGDLAGLLTLWGVPYDVLRLDTHAMTLADFVDRHGQPRYGTIVWTAREQAEHPWQRQDYRIVAEAVRRYHLGLIAVGNKLKEAPLQELTGLRLEGFDAIEQRVAISAAPHFLTRGLAGTTVSAKHAFPDGGPQVTVTAPDVTVLANAGRWPQLTARTLDAASRIRVVWIGGDPDEVFHAVPAFITLFRRALVWTQGYACYKDYGRAVVLRMDDPGTAQSAFLPGWDFPQLTPSQIDHALIAPLQAHHAFLGVGYCAGYPWRPTREIRPSATLDYVDPRGNRQNLRASAEGWRHGVQAGVLEMHSHGLTHMTPDLDTAPDDGKIWWDGDAAHEWPDERWYREFYDMRRDREVDAATQRARLHTAAAWIDDAFGKRPLIFIPGGHAISGDWFTGGEEDGVFTPPHIAETYTYLQAAREGYGLALDTSAHYLDRRRVVALTACSANEPEDNWARGVPAVLLFHDNDVVHDADYLANLLDRLDDGRTRFLSMDEWTGYLHARLAVSAGNNGLRLTIAGDRPFDRFFATHPAQWTLQLCDELRAELQATRLVIDGKATPLNALPECLPIVCSPGARTHTITLER